jgi:spore germination cell wall hydrolase CwlJ-like protein
MAVMQVVLNRVVLPRYPKTVCGVVYQGSGRTTGCQFSFTCDGSLLRRPEQAGWQRARREARQALAGRIFAPIGRATHYHADWMVPYWLPSLDKIAKIRSHIFYKRRD